MLFENSCEERFLQHSLLFLKEEITGQSRKPGRSEKEKGEKKKLYNSKPPTFIIGGKKKKKKL